MATKLLSAQKIASVSTLPAAADNQNAILVHGGNLWFSDGTTWATFGKLDAANTFSGANIFTADQRIQKNLPKWDFESPDGTSKQYRLWANISNTVDGGFRLSRWDGSVFHDMYLCRPSLAVAHFFSDDAGTEILALNDDGSADFAGDINAAKSLSLSGAFKTTGIASQDITGGADNYSLGSEVAVLRLSTTTGDVFSGMSGGSSGRRVSILNVGTASISLPHDSSNSSAANRFYCPSSSTVTVRSNGGVDVIYDAISARWRTIEP